MPLIKSKSKKAFEQNLKTEIEEGTPMKQSLAIAYALKRKAKKMADGGQVEHEAAESDAVERQEHQEPQHDLVDRQEQSKPLKQLAEGGDIEEDSVDRQEHKAPQKDLVDHSDPSKPIIMQKLAKGGVVDRIMAKRKGPLAEAMEGEAEEDHLADSEENEFDDVVKEDSAESHIPSDEEHSDEQEDEDRKDIVSKIMASRRLKDKMPKVK